MDGLRLHNISFELPESARAPVSAWLRAVRDWFDEREQAVAQSAEALLHGTAASPIHRPLIFSVTQVADMQNVLEGVTVQYAVQLIAGLGHHDAHVRIQLTYLIFNLAKILDEKGDLATRSKDLEDIVDSFRTEDRGEGHAGTLTVAQHGPWGGRSMNRTPPPCSLYPAFMVSRNAHL
jgi:hypothetical protein